MSGISKDQNKTGLSGLWRRGHSPLFVASAYETKPWRFGFTGWNMMRNWNPPHLDLLWKVCLRDFNTYQDEDKERSQTAPPTWRNLSWKLRESGWWGWWVRSKAVKLRLRLAGSVGAICGVAGSSEGHVRLSFPTEYLVPFVYVYIQYTVHIHHSTIGSFWIMFCVTSIISTQKQQAHASTLFASGTT